MVKLNKGLIASQKVDEDGVAELIRLHKALDLVNELMAEMDPTDGEYMVNQLHTMATVIESIEFNMQRVWKFPQDMDFHTHWLNVPHCKCPQMDNRDPLYFGRRIINANCPVHGDVK
ncbi:MAG: hypothetical protein DRQ47_01890 [Gammaproteobacteria bacterium]|nr:MAG: hypothetical protein DRQ47_01890 [Gammaproteobacteria bacterium]